MQTCEQRDYSRQSDLVPRETLTSTPIVVVGVGAVGRNVAMSLASIGAESVLLVDFGLSLLFLALPTWVSCRVYGSRWWLGLATAKTNL